MGVSRTTASVVERGLGKTLGCFGIREVSRALAGFGQLDGSVQRRRLLRKADGGIGRSRLVHPES
jgi:hypothetical protein